MDTAVPVRLIGREPEMERFADFRRELEHGGTSFVWIAGEAGCGKSRLLQAWVGQAVQAGWEALSGQCTQDTRADPYGPFLSMLGLCFDKSGRLINDRSVHSIVDQISLEDVFGAVADIPGMSVVAFGIKVGVTVFESRRRPQSGNELLNRNFEFILQLLRQIGRRRSRPILLALDDLHFASGTTYALLEYILTRLEDAPLLAVGTWRAGSPEDGSARIREVFGRQARPERILHLSALSDAEMRVLLNDLCTRALPASFAETLIDFSRGLPGVLKESVRLVETAPDSSVQEASETGTVHSLLQMLIARQLSQLGSEQRALLQCAALIGEHVPLHVLSAPALCDYIGLSERQLLSSTVELADRGNVLRWDGDDALRFTSVSVRDLILDQVHEAVARRDHLRIADSLRSVVGDAQPAQVAAHYLAGGDLEQALEFALHSAEALSRSAAYPEAVEGYGLVLRTLKRLPGGAERTDVQYGVLHAMGWAAEQIGDWDEALSSLQDALALSREDRGREAESLAGLGWLYFQKGEVHLALRYLRRAAELYDSQSDPRGRAQVDYYLGVLYGQQKEWQRGEACFQRFLEAAERHGFSEGRASAYIELGNLCRLQQDWPRAEELLQAGIGLAQTEGDYIALAQGYHHLGNCYARQGRPQAVEVLGRALRIVETRTKQPVQKARIQNTLAETLVRMNRWQEAEKAFQSSSEIKERLGDRAGLAITYGGLGRLYLRQWRFDRAAEYLQRDIALLSDEFDANVAWIQQHTNLIGEARRLQGRLDEADRCLQEALLLSERIPDAAVRGQSQGYSHMLLARLALDRGELETADRECAMSAASLQDTWAAGEVQRTIARLARLRGDLESARQHLDRALALTERGEDIDRAQTYLEAAHLSRDTGDPGGTQRWVGRAVLLARQLCNEELERRARMLLDLDRDGD